MNDHDVMEVRRRLDPLISGVFPGLFDSALHEPDGSGGFLEEMFTFAIEAVELENDGSNESERRALPETAYERVALAIRALTGDTAMAKVEIIRCEECGLTTQKFHGWAFTVGRPGECQGKEANIVTGHHRWALPEEEKGA